MRKFRLSLFFLLLLILFACNGNSNKNEQAQQDSVSVSDSSTSVEPSDLIASDISGLKQDSLRYLFDHYDQNRNYQYVIQSLPVRHLDSVVVFQGDIILQSNIPDDSRLQGIRLDTVMLEKTRTIRQPQMVGIDALSQDRMWPGGVIKYMISEYGDTDELKTKIERAIAIWATTGLKFQRTNTFSDDYLLLEAKSSYTINASPLGRQHGKQLIRLRSDATLGQIIHEIGHSLGLWHEHSRNDRDRYITIVDQNIAANCADQFVKITDKYSFYSTDYDYGSIMHYDAYAFAKTGTDGRKLVTIKTIPPGKSIGQRSGLSASDISGIKQMYHLK